MKHPRSRNLVAAAASIAGVLLLTAGLLEAPSTAAAPEPCFGSYVTATYEASASACWGSTHGPGGVVPQALVEAEARCGDGKVCDITMEWFWFCEDNDCLYMSDGRMHYGCKTGP